MVSSLLYSFILLEVSHDSKETREMTLRQRIDGKRTRLKAVSYPKKCLSHFLIRIPLLQRNKDEKRKIMERKFGED